MKNRCLWIDTAKGLGIILVIYGHISFRPEWWNVWLCSFHMPLFFFLSGLTFNKDNYADFKLFFSTKVKQLVIPYLIFAVIAWLWSFIEQIISLTRDYGFDWRYLLKQGIGIILQIRTTSYGVGVWFIPCIFVAFLLLYFIIKLSKHDNVVIAIYSSICLICGYLYCTYIDIKLPWGIDAAFIAVFFMAMGTILRQKLLCNFKNYKMMVGIGIVSFFINIIFALLNYKVLNRTVGMWSNNYGNLVYFILGAVSGIIVTIVISQFLKLKFIQNIGKHSIFYYGLHIIILEASSYITHYIPMFSNDIVAFTVSTALVILTIIILNFLHPYYEKLYNRISYKCFKA